MMALGPQPERPHNSLSIRPLPPNKMFCENCGSSMGYKKEFIGLYNVVTGEKRYQVWAECTSPKKTLFFGLLTTGKLCSRVYVGDAKLHGHLVKD